MSKLAIDYAMKKRAKSKGAVANEGSGDELDYLVQQGGLEDKTVQDNERGHSDRVKNQDMVDRIMRKRKAK